MVRATREDRKGIGDLPGRSHSRIVRGSEVVPIALYAGSSGVQGETEKTDYSYSEKRLAVLDAAVNIIARQGLRTLTLDVIAAASHCSRATLYRQFPGGKEAILGGIAETETARLFSAIASSMVSAESVRDALAMGICEAARFIEGHPALQMLLDKEPDFILPYLAFGGFEVMLDQVVAFACPLLRRWIDQATAKRVVQWAARLTVSYLLCPAEDIALTNIDTSKRMVDTYIMPGLETLVETSSRR
ncbi:MAG: TetR/AcrR family transcriptional regulator [Acidimicrobiales bacterium]